MKATFVLTAVTLSLSTVPASTLADEAQKEVVAENFLQADANADGALTFEEFTTLIDLNAEDEIGRAALVKRMGKQSTAFGRLDANADGIVTTEEISAQAAR
ncbi:MAG: hypothetical protein AAGC81_17010 [Pseudomonadota bacterium]